MVFHLLQNVLTTIEMLVLAEREIVTRENSGLIVFSRGYCILSLYIRILAVCCEFRESCYVMQMLYSLIYF
jgi:hypothetical protein